MNHQSSLYGTYAYTDTLKRIYYGPGSISTALPKLLDELKVEKALVVTGKSLRFKVWRCVSRHRVCTLTATAARLVWSSKWRRF